jgi:hypothetical protein
LPLVRRGSGRHAEERNSRITREAVTMADEIPTERVVKVSGEFSLLPDYLGEDIKVLRVLLLLDPRFQMVHYLDAEGVKRTAAGTAAELAPILEHAGYVVKSGSVPP